MSNLDLYLGVPSRGMTVHWLLEEIGAPYNLHVLDLEAEEHKTPGFLAINPMGKVPVLRHDDVVVTETAAICAYLAELFPDKNLNVPVGSPLRGPYLSWLFFAPATAEQAILWQAIRGNVPSLEYQPFPEIDAVARTLQSAVAGREFIVGDHFTAADVMIGSTLMWSLNMMPLMPRLPELIDYWSRLEQRPAWQRSQKALAAYRTDA